MGFLKARDAFNRERSRAGKFEAGHHEKQNSMPMPASNKKSIRVVTRGADGSIRMRDYDSPDSLLRLHVQVGVDDCSTDLSLRGMPVFRGLIGPIPEGKNVVRYESPEVFETLTKEWSTARAVKRSRRRGVPVETSAANPASAT